MKKAILSAAMLLALAGCAAAIQPDTTDASIARQIYESTPKEEGEILISSIGQWYPNTRGYDFSNDLNREVSGVLVLTSKSLMFERWGGDFGLTVATKIPLTAIQSASTARWGMSNRLVIKRANDRYDSFAVSNPEDVLEQITKYLPIAK